MAHLYIFISILLIVYGQITIKWQVNLAGVPPIVPIEKLWFLLHLLLNPWIISGFVAAFLSSLSWMGAMSKFPLSYAYPFTGINFVLIIISSAIFFHESITLPKLIAMFLIVSGIVIGSKG
jgi:multidrug transporter EmrE-like cation transporter